MTKTTVANAFAALELQVDTANRMVILHPGTRMPLKDASGIEAYVDVLSGDSDVAEKFRKEIRAARLRTRNPSKFDADKENRELLGMLTTGWYLLDFNGTPIDLEHSRASAIELFANHKMAWLTDQVDEFAGDRANFFKASSTT